MYSVNQGFSPEEAKDQQRDLTQFKNEARKISSSSKESSSSSSSKESSSNNLRKDYHRSSSSSSTASSGKNLVKYDNPSHHRSNKSHTDSFYGRLERLQNSRDGRYYHHRGHRRPDGLSSSSPSPSPEIHKKPQPKFMLGPPSTPGSSRGYHSPLRSSPSPSPEPPSTPHHERLTPEPHLLHPGYALNLHPQHLLTPPDRNTKIGSLYESYWHIPRASLWCTHKDCHENQKCSQCQLKEDTTSNCSSVNPPPTFTAMDNYHPIRKKSRKCSCGAIFAATTVFSTLVLILIAAFILYIEMVLKQTEYVPDPM